MASRGFLVFKDQGILTGDEQATICFFFLICFVVFSLFSDFFLIVFSGSELFLFFLVCFDG